jgi:hypothetical protein
LQPKQRIRPKFGSFREQKLFLDCTLKTSSNDIDCHRLVLARYSRYFSRLFPTTRDRVIPAAFDPGGLLPSVIDFFYSSEIVVTADRVPALAAVAEHYEMPELSRLLLDFFPQKITVENALGLLHGLVTADLPQYLDLLVPFLAEHFRRFKQGELFQCISSRVFGRVLTDPIFPVDLMKIELIDSFCSQKGQLEDDERDALSSAVDLGQPRAYECMLNYNCDWLPFRKQREFLNVIISERRSGIHACEDDQGRVEGDQVSRWYVLQWFTSIAKAQLLTDIDSIRFIGTFGGLSEFIDPLKFRCMDVRFHPRSQNILGLSYLIIQKHFSQP